MAISVLIQLIAACLGVIGSLFFAIGVMRQSTAAMADIASTYFDSNLYLVANTAAQKADYLFGGVFIVLAFAGQVIALLIPSDAGCLAIKSTRLAPYGAIGGTIVVFMLLRMLSQRLASRYERQIRAELTRRMEEAARST
jgi:hypothetical protein